MDSVLSSESVAASAPGTGAGGMYVRDSVRQSVKLLIVGHFAVGKTTLVGTLSEIRPLRTEERMTQAGAPVDDLSGVPDKTHTTVAMDFGRLTLSDRLVLYLFGTPGQGRFKRLWEDLARGALGALVLVDTRRLDQSFEIMDLVERHGLPYAVAVNAFDGAPVFPEEEVREALDLHPATPLVTCDARDRASSARALIALVDHLIALDREAS
ncbi:ATP/GTP-binding protein [Actinomadura keratinilytica]|jgi:signal recognition particle receptor subunit beta|uniref:ATP/GTP-binding protein n=2 Tax=Actinomadura keratinilytica TaxID=547461 RepID=A0ABP7Z5C5_9ACTN